MLWENNRGYNLNQDKYEMKLYIYGSGCDIDPIYEVEDIMSTTKMKYPLKLCGIFGYNTFTSNHF